MGTAYVRLDDRTGSRGKAWGWRPEGGAERGSPLRRLGGPVRPGQVQEPWVVASQGVTHEALEAGDGVPSAANKVP